jgi:hypothetical protein
MITLARLSDATIDLTFSGVPSGTTVTKAYLAIKTSDAASDASSLVVNATPSGNVATFQITDVQSGALTARRYALSAKAILSDGRAIRLDLDDDQVQVINPGVEAVS